MMQLLQQQMLQQMQQQRLQQQQQQPQQPQPPTTMMQPVSGNQQPMMYANLLIHALTISTCFPPPSRYAHRVMCSAWCQYLSDAEGGLAI